MKRIELLSPAGTYEAFLASVQNGADAIYLGGKLFGARAYAANFDNEDLVNIIKYAHAHNVKVYITVNTIVFNKEIEELIKFLDFIYLNDVDAVIVQDLGIINLIKNRYKNLDIIASTQMNIHNIEGAQRLKQLGIKRVVIARETDLQTIRKILDEVDIEVEVFAHGALCVCYSGECLLSSFIGKRSGNRGKCAQPCRLTYTLLCNNEKVSEEKYLLSMKDLCTLDNLDEIIKSGVGALKIEGRMKSSEYVALTTSIYRKAIDDYYLLGKSSYSKEDLNNLKKTFNRGFTSGYISNESFKNIVNIERGNHQGVEIGEIVKVDYGRIFIKLLGDVCQQDGLRIISNVDAGLLLNRIYKDGKLVREAFKGDTIALDYKGRVNVKDKVVKTLDVKLNKMMQKTFDKDYRKSPIDILIYAKKDEKFKLVFKSDNNQVICEGSYIVEAAINSPISKERIIEQVAKLGDTPFYAKDVSINMDDGIMIPVKIINDLRREAADKLLELEQKKYKDRVINSEEFVYEELDYNVKKKFKIKVRTLEQLTAISSMDIDEVYFEDIENLEKAQKLYPNLLITPILPRIVDDYTKYKYERVVVQELGGVNLFNQVITGQYLNITNSYAIDSLLKQKVSTIQISPECSYEVLVSIVEEYQKQTGKIPDLEVVVYGRTELMISKYCPIAKIEDKPKHCNKCKIANYAFLDRKGYVMPLIGDQNCNIRIYNNKRTSLIDYVGMIEDLGINNLVIEFVDESVEEIVKIATEYKKAFDKEPYNLFINDVTYGHFKEGVE